MFMIVASSCIFQFGWIYLIFILCCLVSFGYLYQSVAVTPRLEELKTFIVEIVLRFNSPYFLVSHYILIL